MNAHTPVALRPCRVADIAAQYELLERADAELVGSRQAPDGLNEGWLGQQIRDRIEALALQAEWVEAESLAGIYFQTLLLGVVTREIAEHEDPGSHEYAHLVRRMERLNNLILAGMERVGDFEGELFGKRHLALRQAEFRSVLARFSGG